MIYKAFFIIIGVFLVILYAFPLIETKLNFGNIFGISLGFMFVTIGSLYNMLKNLLFFKIAMIIIFICLLFLISILIYIIFRSRHTATNENTVIVLGCRIFGDRPSLSLIERCKVASRHLNENPNAVAILSGGQGSDEFLTEAEAMKKLMISYGIDEKRLYLEDKSTTTNENILFSKKIIEENNLDLNIAIATSDYHQARAVLIAKRNGIYAKSIPSKTLSRVKAPFFTREVFGLIKEIMLK